jgi:cyanophycinase
MKTIAALLLLVCAASPAFCAKQYSYYRVGNPADITTATTAGTVLMGGGTDVDAAFPWMASAAGTATFS